MLDAKRVAEKPAIEPERFDTDVAGAAIGPTTVVSAGAPAVAEVLSPEAGEVEVVTVTDLGILDEPLHAVAHVVHLENLGGGGPTGWVFGHQLGDQLSQLGAVGVGDGFWLILHNLEDKPQEVISLEWLFQSA